MVESETYYAVVVLNSSEGVTGTVKFVQQKGHQTRVYAELTGLAEGEHGFHVHEFGNLTNGCTSAGAHFNPAGLTHGGPDDEVRHVGDLGNIKAGADGKGLYDSFDRLIQLYGDVNNIIGRSVVVHQKVDDLGRGGDDESKKTGNAGPRIACGVIGLSGPLDLPARQ